MSAMTTRLAGICATLFVICMVVGVMLGFDSPDTEAKDQEWIDYIHDGSKLTTNIIGGYFMVVAGILFLIFLAAMYRRFRAAEGGDGIWSLAMLVTGIGWVVGLTIGAILIQTIPGAIKFGSAPDPTPETARWMGQVGFGVLLVSGGLCAAAFAAITSTLILRTKTLPAWLGFFGFVAALAMVFAAIFLPMIIFGLWMLAMGIVLLLRGNEPAGASATA